MEGLGGEGKQVPLGKMPTHPLRHLPGCSRGQASTTLSFLCNPK